jgi:hypothetical protein
MLDAGYASINSRAIHILSDLYAFLLHLGQEGTTRNPLNFSILLSSQMLASCEKIRIYFHVVHVVPHPSRLIWGRRGSRPCRIGCVHCPPKTRGASLTSARAAKAGPPTFTGLNPCALATSL